MTALLTLEEIKAHLRVDHDADDDMLMDKVRQATAVLLAYIQGSRERMQSGAEMAQAEIRIWVRGQSGREITAASRLHVLSGPWRDRILNVVGLPVPDTTGGRLEILCRLGGEK